MLAISAHEAQQAGERVFSAQFPFFNPNFRATPLEDYASAIPTRLSAISSNHQSQPRPTQTKLATLQANLAAFPSI